MAKVELSGDLNQLEGQIKPITTPGVFPAEITKCMPKKSKAGEPKLTFIAKLLDGPDAGENVMFDTSLQVQALWKLRQLRDVIGAPATDGRTIDTDDYIGRRLKLAVSLKEFTNKSGQTEMRTQVDDFLPA